MARYCPEDGTELNVVYSAYRTSIFNKACYKHYVCPNCDYKSESEFIGNENIFEPSDLDYDED